MLNLINVLSALLMPAIVLLGMYIAWQQYKINKNRLKLELFNRRYKVYDALMNIFSSVLREGKLSREIFLEYSHFINEGKFLFSTDIAEYLDKAYNKINMLSAHMNLLENLRSIDDKNMERITKDVFEIQTWISGEFPKAADRFEKFLRLDL